MSRRPITLLVATASAALMAAPARAQDGHDDSHGSQPAAKGARVGLLLADHGEPPEYNEDTYYSFRDFVDGLMEAGVIPSWLRYVDAGTIVWDANCPAARTPTPTHG